MIYFSADKNEAGEDEEYEDDEVSEDIQCLFTKANESVKFTKSNKFLFVPVSLPVKKTICKDINILKASGEQRSARTYGNWFDKKREQSSIHHIVGDGNCLFRAVSYVMSGSQEHHDILRKLAVEKMYSMGSKFTRITGENATDYIKRTKMNELGVWGTEVEIYALSTLLKTCIFVFLSNENNNSWIPHYPRLDPGDLCESECIYLRNKHYHFDVVLEM